MARLGNEGKKRRRDIQEICQKLTTRNPEYMKALKEALETRTAPPQIEALILMYAHGKPKEAKDDGASAAAVTKAAAAAIEAIRKTPLRLAPHPPKRLEPGTIEAQIVAMDSTVADPEKAGA